MTVERIARVIGAGATRMHLRRAGAAVPVALSALLLAVGCGGGGPPARHRSSAADPDRVSTRADPDPASTEADPEQASPNGTAASGPSVVVTVENQAIGRPIAPGFLGLSLEYPAVRFYTGHDPSAINPVFVQLIRNLTPGQAPVLRIGGDSTDTTWWPIAGIARPRWVQNTLTPGWLATTRALAGRLGARLILGINLAADSPTIAGAEARALIDGIGRRYVEALEIGNEPEAYGQLPWYFAAPGKPVFARPSWYSTVGLASYTKDFSAIRKALPDVPLAGPATGGARQLADLSRFLDAEHGLGLVTIHRYPLDRCTHSPDPSQRATLANLLSPRASRGLMQGVARYVALAHSKGVPFRVDETNSVACGGQLGLSDTFASSLWVIDALFAMARSGVDGVNVHIFPGARYSLFAMSDSGGGWHALVHPEYYGLLVFARAAPPGSRLLSTRVGGPPTLRAWATLASDGTRRIVLINDSLSQSRVVLVRASAPVADATLQRLTAPSVHATVGVTLAGQGFGRSTSTGTLAGTAGTHTLQRARGGYRVILPAASAALVTVPVR